MILSPLMGLEHRISASVYNNSKEVFSRQFAKHWWLTGFRKGMSSKSENLKMDICIELIDIKMRDIFVKALKDKKYKNISESNCRVYFKW